MNHSCVACTCVCVAGWGAEEGKHQGTSKQCRASPDPREADWVLLFAKERRYHTHPSFSRQNGAQTVQSSLTLGRMLPWGQAIPDVGEAVTAMVFDLRFCQPAMDRGHGLCVRACVCMCFLCLCETKC